MRLSPDFFQRITKDQVNIKYETRKKHQQIFVNLKIVNDPNSKIYMNEMMMGNKKWN